MLRVMGNLAKLKFSLRVPPSSPIAHDNPINIDLGYF